MKLPRDLSGAELVKGLQKVGYLRCHTYSLSSRLAWCRTAADTSMENAESRSVAFWRTPSVGADGSSFAMAWAAAARSCWAVD
jgi:hypothetical protein